jgi:hypothetical protein
MDAAQKAIYQRVAQVKSQSPPTSADQQEPQTATIDVAEQIKKLGELRDQGLLTEQEFDWKKQSDWHECKSPCLDTIGVLLINGLRYLTSDL